MKQRESYQVWEIIAGLRDEYLDYCCQLRKVIECLDITGSRIGSIDVYINHSIPGILDFSTVCVKVTQKRNQFQYFYESLSSSTGLPIPWTDATYELKRQGPNYTVVPKSLYRQFRPSVQIVDQEKLNDAVFQLLHYDFFAQFGYNKYFDFGKIDMLSFSHYGINFILKQPDSMLSYSPSLDQLHTYFFKRPTCSSFKGVLESSLPITSIKDRYRSIIDKNLEAYSFLSLDDSCYYLDGREHDFEITHPSTDNSFCLKKVLK